MTAVRLKNEEKVEHNKQLEQTEFEKYGLSEDILEALGALGLEPTRELAVMEALQNKTIKGKIRKISRVKAKKNKKIRNKIILALSGN